MGRRLPVAGQRPRGDPEEGSDEGPEPEDPVRPTRDPMLRLILPAVGALVILAAGLIGQCYGG